jgi:hypothetical protein
LSCNAVTGQVYPRGERAVGDPGARRSSGEVGEVVGDVVLLVVPGPAERGAVVVGVSDSGVGAEVDECSDEVEVAVECGFVEGCAAVGGVDVEADVDEQRTASMR